MSAGGGGAAYVRLVSALADRYSMSRELGSGGMATVYLAQDLKHGRDVAIKVLHPELGAALGGDRFLAEIKTTARLQHPHILPLLDSGEAEGLLYYVMPYVAGETLRARLERDRQLPISEAVRIAREVADALTAAHAIGIIHRDIKPENILLQGGHALVADFGISLAVQQAGGHRMTQTGLSLGTPQYMSPEQAMGERTVDARADVYALGAVTYEMLAGEAPFTGSTVQAIVAKLMTDPARPLTELRKSVPLHVDAAVLSALEKLPADRLPSAAAFAEALGDPSFSSSRAPLKARSQRGTADVARQSWWIGSLALNALLVAAAVFLWQRKPDAPVSRHQVTLWQNRIPDPLAPGARIVAIQAAIAPDGSSIVFSDSTSGGYQLFLKERGAGTATAIAGTEGAASPFFSPDGRWIGYITTDGRVRKVAASGGGSVTLADHAGREYQAGAWLDDGTIVYSDARSGLARIPANAGAAVSLSLAEGFGQVATLWPLPGSRGFLFTSCSGNCSLSSNVYVYDFEADSARLVVAGAAGAWFSPTGHLLYTTRDGGLYASSFDPRSLERQSGTVSVIDDVEPTSFTMSASGSAMYTTAATGRTPSELVWVSRDGNAEAVDSTWRGRFEYPAISPDGSSLAVSVREKITDLWIRRSDGTRKKVIAGGVANWRPSWMPDGRSLVFTSIRSAEDPNAVAVYRARVEGNTREELVLKQPFGIWEAEVSRDSQWLVVRLDEANFDSNVRARRLNGDTTLVPLLVDSTQALSVAISPDTRWIAYASDEAGQRYDVYVASFPDMGSKVMVSGSGGTEPRWSRNGRELFFESGGRLVSVSIPPGPTLNPSNPRALFSLSGYRRARNRQQYDVGPDGRFVMIREAGGARGTSAVYVENWLAELRTKLQQ